jgi:hypothetical protein
VPDYTIRDRDGCYGQTITKRLAAMGIGDHPIAPRSPWKNGHAERLSGSIRRECFDHTVAIGEDHLVPRTRFPPSILYGKRTMTE